MNSIILLIFGLQNTEFEYTNAVTGKNGGSFMNKEEIITVLSELHKITGFRISLHGADFEEIAAYPEAALPFCQAVNAVKEEHKRCLECDKIACKEAFETKKTHSYRCRFGLTEAVSPLYNFGVLTGFLMMGQVADSEGARRLAVEKLRSAGIANIEVLADKIPLVRGELVSSYFKIMTICAQYLTLSGAMPGQKRSYAEETKKYIHEHLSGRITVEDICRDVGCSKSTLLVSFKRAFGTTVGSYITDCRLAVACAMLTESERSINEISLETGFYDQSYFSKVFSAKYGMSPKEYRQKNKN